LFVLENRPRDLKPFPNALVMQYTGHTGAVRSIALDQTGEYMISGGEDGTVRMWQVDTGLLVQQWNFGAPVNRVAWNPNPQLALCAIATGNRLVFIATGTGNADVLAATEEAVNAGGKELPLLNSLDEDDTDDADEEGADSEESKRKALRWRRVDPSKCATGQFPSHTRTGTAIGPRVVVLLNGPIANISWHSKGDYIAAVTTDLTAKCVGIHRLSGKQSRYPFKKR
jgi:ribosome biogenesis protein ERB1